MFNKIKLRKITVLNKSFLWKRGHLHLEEFDYSECIEKVIIYLENYKNSPLILFFREEDNTLLKSLGESQKWFIGYPDQGVIWKSKTGKIVPQGENNDSIQINLNHPSIIEKIIKHYYANEWNPEKHSKPHVLENALTIIDEIDLS